MLTPPRHGRAHFYALFTALVWSFAFVCIRYVVTRLGSTGASAWDIMLTLFLARLGISAILYLPHLAHGWKQLGKLDRGNWWLLIGMSLAGTFGYHLPLNYGAQYLPSGMVSLMIAMSPVFAGLFGWLLLRERLGWHRLLGLFVGLIGITVCLFAQGKLEADSVDALWLNLAAPASVLASAMAGALFSVSGRRLPASLPRGLAMAFALVMASLVALPFWRAEYISMLATLGLRGWCAMLYLSAICLYLASMTWLEALRKLDAVQVTIYLNATTALAMFWGVLLYNEPINAIFILGASAVIGAILLVSRPPPPTPDESEDPENTPHA